MRKKLLTGIILGGIMSSMMVPSVFAANSTVTIQAEPTMVDITVSSTAPMIFHSDGRNTVPTNFTINNNSALGGIYLNDIQLTADSSSQWKIAKEGTSLKSKAADTKTITLKLGAQGAEKYVVPASNAQESNQGSVNFASSDFKIASNDSKILSFVVDRCAFTTEVPNAKAFDMVLNFNFE